jgi:ferric-dicitrate binding protein FerR (iron transport regulator)
MSTHDDSDLTAPENPDRASADSRALDRMVREVKDERLPSLDWDRIERGLMARIDEREALAEKRRRMRARSPFAGAAAIAAAAAVLALGLGSVVSSSESAKSTPVTERIYPSTLTGEQKIAALSDGDVVETGAEPRLFSEPGVLAWTLAPHSRVTVRAKGVAGVGHVVTLDRGAIRAEVTPRSPAEGLVESFAVEVAGTRVAVHGTAFSVSRADDAVWVDVEHGAVAVGPVGHVGVTSGRLLVGPSRASFSLDGGRTARFLPRDGALVKAPPVAVATRGPDAPSAAVAPSAGPAAAEHLAPEKAERPRESDDGAAPSGPRSARSADAARDAVAAAPEPPAAAPETAPAPGPLTRAGVESHLRRCFAKVYGSGSSPVKLSVSSKFRISVNADGTVKSARFDPPLRTEVNDCAGGAIAGRFADGPAEIDIPVTFTP